MAADAELGAIIGGCVAGVIVLIAIIAVIVCLCCGKRRRKKERGAQQQQKKNKKFQQLSPHTTPSHSQPSSLGHHVGVPNHPPPSPGDPRLPKVGSNGLWMGTPGICAATPSPAYYYGRPGGGGSHHYLQQQQPPPHFHPYPAAAGVMQPAVMQRASSESRIPQPPDCHVPAGPGMYAPGGNSQQRIYHSQQLSSLTPLYEVVDPRNGSIYDVYQIGGGSKTKLLQNSSGKSDDRHSKKVQRSQSDANHDPSSSSSSKRPHRHRDSQESHRSSKTGSVTKETAQVHQPKDKAADGKETGGVTNAAFVGSSEKITEAVKTAVAASAATDSMKILAKNKTDDEKKVVNPSSSSDAESKQPSPMPTPAPAPDPSLHYTYGGDIYAVPDKEENKRRSRSENPILARMQDMILERAEGLEPGQAPDPITDLTETHEPLIVTSVYGDPLGDHGASLIQNPIYQEVEEVVAESRSSDLAVTQGVDRSSSRVAAAVGAVVYELDSGAHSAGDRVQASGVALADDVAASSVVTSLRDAGAREVGGQQGGDTTMVKESLEPRWSMDTDAATDEISRAGKHISVTAEAFEFLDTYLSDEDGGDTHQSPPSSPVMSGGDELMY